MFSKDDIPPHPLLAAAAPAREVFEASSHRHGPVLITRSPLESSSARASGSALATPLPFNTDELVSYDTELASGVCGIRIADLPSSNPAWFHPPGTTLHMVMRGTFKRPVAAADIWTGQEFPAVSRWVPAVVLQALYTATAKLFAATTWVSGEADEVTGKVAGYMTPVLATAQAIHVAAAAAAAAAGGDDSSTSSNTLNNNISSSSSGGGGGVTTAATPLPDLWVPTEDCRLLGDPSLVTPSGGPVTPAQRRKHFDRPDALRGVTLVPGYTYTFHFWQSWCEPATYKIHLPGHFGTMSLLQFSMGIPLQIMAKDRSNGQYVVNLLMWHKGLLYRKDSGLLESGSSKGSSTSWWAKATQQQGAEEEGGKAGSSGGKEGGGKKGGMAQRLRANLKAFTSLV